MLLWFLYEYWSCWQVSSLFFLVGEYHEAVNHLTKAVAVCNQPQQLLQLFHGTLPDHVFQLLIEKLNDMSPSQQFVSTVRKIILWMSSRDLWARNKKCDQSRENVHQRVFNTLPMLYQRFANALSHPMEKRSCTFSGESWQSIFSMGSEILGLDYWQFLFHCPSEA